MDKEILTPLNALETSLDTLVRSLTTSQTYSAGPKAARDLITADDELEKALSRLRKHQENVAQLQRLRAEADSLNAKIKNTVLTCVSLRKELGEINQSILEDSDDDDEEDANPVDYETLLSFATRIGKHNAIAAQEAEKLVEQQYLTAKKTKAQRKTQPSIEPNGIHTGDTTATTGPSDEERPSSSAQQTQQINEQISEFQNRRNWDRAQVTAPFPNAEILRIGELGKLQIQREQNGEDYSDGYVEALVKQSELKQELSGSATQRNLSIQAQSKEAAPAQTKPPGERRPAQPQPQPQQQQQQERRPEVKPKGLNLDFPEDDDDDDDSDGDGD